MALIYSKNIVSVASAQITARTELTGYAAENVMDFWNLTPGFRANDLTTNDYLMTFDFGAAKALQAIFLNDVNFNKVKIQGHATDSWASPSFASAELTVSQNDITGRYNIYIPLTAFDYRYLRIFVPTGTTAVGDYTAKWKVGSFCPLLTITELSRNMSGYTYTGEIKHTINEKASGGPDVVDASDLWQWKGQLMFGDRSNTYESELWTLNRVKPSEPMVFYENSGVTSRAYLCHKNSYLTGTISGPNGFQGSVMQLVELI